MIGKGTTLHQGYSSFLKNDNRRAVGQRGDCCLSAGPHPAVCIAHPN
jgi:hypothetical protein